MKRIPIAFIATAFFACSDNSLDLGEAAGPKTTNCFVASEDKCYSITESVCASINGISNYKFCASDPSTSSSSEELDLSSSSSTLGDGDSSSSSEEQGGDDSSSSSEEQGGDDSSSSAASETSSSSRASSSSSRVSSSSSAPSSSSEAPPPPSSSSSSVVATPNLTKNCGAGYTGVVNTCETFRFRNFDYSSSGSRVFFFDRHIYAANSPDGTGSALYQNLQTDESCNEVSIEVSGGGLTSIPTGTGGSNYPTIEGPITAYAVATCNGSKVTLAITTAEIYEKEENIPPPPIAAPVWECSIPPYVGNTENMGKFLTLKMDENDDPSRCAGIRYSASSVTVGTGRTITITTTGTCTGAPAAPAAPSCTRSNVTVATNYVYFDHNDEPKYIINRNSNTVIEIAPELSPNGFGCEYASSTGNNTGNISFSLNGTTCSQNQSWWTSCNLPAYAANGNRVLFNANLTGDLACTTYR
jgi:hypothetical protein